MEALRQLVRTAERCQVPACDEFRFETKALPGNPPLELGGEEPVIPPCQDACLHIGPGWHRPRLGHGCHRLLCLASLECFGHDLG